MKAALLLAAAVTVTYGQPRLDWVKQFGGNGADRVAAITQDAQGNLYLAGATTSTDLPANGFRSSPLFSSGVRLTASGDTQTFSPPTGAYRLAADGTILFALLPT